jgi:hypothetical protein
MSLGMWVAGGLLLALPVVIHVALLVRSPYLRMHLGSWLATLGTGAALVIPVTLLERVLQGWAQIDPVAGTGGQVTLLLYAFLIVAPLKMAMVTLAVAPFWRLRRLRMRAGLSRALETKEGVSFAVSAAVGFSVASNLIYFWLQAPSEWLSLARIALSLATFIVLCGLWGYVLGRNAARGMRGRRFSSAVFAATVFLAVCEQLILRNGTMALLSSLPVLASMLVVAYALWFGQRGKGSSSGGALSSILASAPAPSINAIREAFRRQDRPLTLRWISFGAIVTTGMITTGIVGAVFLGHELGLDFSAVDRHEAGAEAMAPLALLGLGALAAFPSSGYLLARASGARSVLEPAMASALAMVLVMVFMGMVAPVSVVFVIAFAPIAFALSCAGAWVGLGS